MIDIKKNNGASVDKKQNSHSQLFMSTTENESFNKHYNKELKVSEDEIPMVLLELNESALSFITKDQYEKALLLLQKAHGVLDVVDLSSSRRDQLIALEIFLNMALCYQKLGQLEECSLCLETCIEQFTTTDYESMLQNRSLAQRVMRMKIECKLRMQLCAIFSQLHRHKEALDQAYESAKLGNLIIHDQINLCEFISKRVDFENIQGFNKLKKQLNYHESASAIMIDHYSSFSEDGGQIEDQSVDSVGQFQTELAFHNNLEDSISLVEKTAKKLLPIYRELHKRLVQFRKISDQNVTNNDKDEGDISDFDRIETEVFSDGGNQDDSKKQNQLRNQTPEKKYQLNLLDMRHMLGFLNQSEWVNSLNIGNIMQISPIQHEDLIIHRRNEQEITRDAFLESVSFMIVAYFCISTEIRFIIQLKEEINKIANFEIATKQKESEYWHAKSLEIASTFLPSDCPLLNHVLLSYQKHHAPSSQTIPENQSTDENLEVMKPLLGIENAKFQPIIRRLQNLNIQLSPLNIKTATGTVKKLLKKIEPNKNLALQNLTPLESNAQYSTVNKTPNSNAIHKDKIKKIMKFEKIMKKFCREIGLDKRTLMSMIVGKQDDLLAKNQQSSSKKNLLTQSKENILNKDYSQVNTGVAAQMAYSNIIQPIDPENDNLAQMRIRQNGGKSRNQNFSLSDNRENNALQALTQPSNDIKNRSSIGEILNTRNYESESTLLFDIKNNLNENSFNESIMEKNRLNFNNNINRDATQSSIMGQILNKRKNSQEKLGSMIGNLRPKSSKGNRNTTINSTATQIPLVNNQQQQIVTNKFLTAKSEERTKSQQQQRTLTSGSKQKQSINDNFSKILQQNLMMNQQQQQSKSINKKAANSQLFQNQSMIEESNTNKSLNQDYNHQKRNKVNYEDLKKYLIKEYQQQKAQNKLSNLYLKQDEMNALIGGKKKSSQGGRAGKGLTQQSQFALNGDQPGTQKQTQAIYLGQVRPTSVGQINSVKKSDKNKAILQEMLLAGAAKQKIIQGTPIVGFVGNHNLSVNITNIAGNVNGSLRQGQQSFFDEDAVNNASVKQINNANGGSGYIRGMHGGFVGIEGLLPSQKINALINQGNLSFEAKRKSQQN